MSGPAVARGPGSRGARSTDATPWTDSRFWVLQIVVLALYLVRLAASLALRLDATAPALEFTTVLLFLVPVVYAALIYGFGGAVVTSGWVTLLAVPRFAVYLGDRNYSGAWAEMMQVLVLDVLAFLVGQRVTSERLTRQQAETASEAHRSTQALYRELFDSNRAPMLIVNGEGYVVESNSSAQRVFGRSSPSPGHGDGPGGHLRLVDVIGADAAGQVLTRLVSAQSGGAPGDVPGGRAGGRVEPVPFDVDGEPVLLRPTATMIDPADPAKGMQVVFEDVTTETRRHDRMEAYAARVLLGHEEERRHIAQELHDGPLQALIHLCRQIDTVEGKAAQGTAEPDALAGMRSTVEHTVAELRAIAKGLRPSVLDDLGLSASVGQLVDEAAARSRFGAAFAVTGTARRLSAPVELAVFRIAQEALSNVERHADAERVTVGLCFETEGLRLVVTDDGVGFDASSDPSEARGDSLGLPGMAERAQLIGSTLRLHSRPGGGTSVELWVPTDPSGNGQQPR